MRRGFMRMRTRAGHLQANVRAKYRGVDNDLRRTASDKRI